ncbi:hypothetical protein OESDEN_15763 [Oesophagostomum dentatum]|uniref:Uncharacterized protein n=1 Tax=Oesophagostomum dentatum TaxID=61180 RepID=A0A0B1SKV6_OESDE|nr:hypothetical protein OESDEN_15763 [Oesophagostomum dentatum]
MNGGAECPDTVAYLQFVPQYVSMMIHTLLNLSAVVVNSLFIIVCFKHLHFHFNCRLLIITLIFVNICHSLTYATMLIIQLVKAFGSRDRPCEALVGGVMCFIIRLITSPQNLFPPTKIVHTNWDI